MKKIGACVAAAALGWAVAGIGYAKLPALSDEQKAKASEARAKADDAAKKDAEALTKYQDRAADNFKRTRASVKPEAQR
jgi:hypothetical protein